MKSFLACAGAAFALCGHRAWGFNSYLAGLRSFSSDSFDVPVLAARKGYRRPIKPLSPRVPEATETIVSHSSAADMRTIDVKKQRKRNGFKEAESREMNSTVATTAIAPTMSVTFFHDNGTVYSSGVRSTREASKTPTIRLATSLHANDTTVQQKIDNISSPRLIEILNAEVARELRNAATEPKEVKECPHVLSETALLHNQKGINPISLDSETSDNTNEHNSLKPTSYSGFGVKPMAPFGSGIESYLGTISSVKAEDCVVTLATTTHKNNLSLSYQESRSDRIDTKKIVQPFSLEGGASEIRNQNESPGLPAAATTTSSSYSVFGKKPWAPKYTNGSYLSHLESGSVPHAPVTSSIARSLSPVKDSSTSGYLVGLASSASSTASDKSISQITDSNDAKMSTGDYATPANSSPIARSLTKTAERTTWKPITDDGLPRKKSTLDDSENEEPLLVTTPALNKKLNDYSGFGVKPKAPPRSVSTGVYASVLENGSSGTLDVPIPAPGKAASNKLDVLLTDLNQDRCEANPTSLEIGTPITSFPKRSFSPYNGIGVNQPAPKLSGYANNLGFACDDVPGIASEASSGTLNLSGSSSVSLPKTSYTGFGVKPKTPSALNNEPIGATTADATTVHESVPATHSKMEAVKVPKSSYTGFGVKPRALTTNVGSYVASLECGAIPVVTSDERATPVPPKATPVQRTSYTGFGVKPRASVVRAAALTTNAKADESSTPSPPTSDAVGNVSNPKATTIPSIAAFEPPSVTSADPPRSLSQPKPTVVPPSAKTSYSGFGVKTRVPSVPSLGDNYLHQLHTNRACPLPATPTNEETSMVPSAAAWIQPASPTDMVTSTNSGTDYLASLSSSSVATPIVPLPEATAAPTRSSYTGFGPATTVAWKTKPQLPGAQRRELLPQGGTGSYYGGALPTVGGGPHNATTLGGSFE